MLRLRLGLEVGQEEKHVDGSSIYMHDLVHT